MKLAPNIFRAYDIRGVYPTELNEMGAVHIGKAIGTLAYKKGFGEVSPPKVVVGMDDRESSPILSDKLIEGLISTGCNVTDVGVSLTPVIHFLTTTQAFDVGVNVTASHNPKEFNGFRLDFANATPFSYEEILELAKMIESEDYVSGFGTSKHAELLYLYIEHLSSQFSFKRKFKVIIDCGNGASSVVAPRVFEALGCKVIPTFCSLDSSFPHGVPDPENPLFMDELEKRVLENACDVGFAFDTDGDRAGVVDERGVHYSTDRLLALFAEYVLKDNPGGTVVYDVKSSGFLKDWIKDLGGIPKMIKTGHTYFTAELKKGAVLGCEYSGHAFFGKGNFGYDDGIYAMLKVLEIMDTTGLSVSRLMSKHPKRVSSPEIKISCPDDKKFDVVETVVTKVKGDNQFNSVSTIDGARVEVTDTGWFLIRASNTTPRLSIRAEGIDDKELVLMLQRVHEVLSEFTFLDLSLLGF